jgi:hypothetical protein
MKEREYSFLFFSLSKAQKHIKNQKREGGSYIGYGEMKIVEI